MQCSFIAIDLWRSKREIKTWLQEKCSFCVQCKETIYNQNVSKSNLPKSKLSHFSQNVPSQASQNVPSQASQNVPSQASQNVPTIKWCL